jgi:hypothetical protein
MAYRLFKPGKALGYAVLIWLVGFVWGSFVFMTPALRRVSPLPFVSQNPAISFPILFIWLIMAFVLARSYLKDAHDRAGEGLKLGALWAGVNFVLDLLVLLLLLRAGFGYFISATVWLGYALLLCVPWRVGRSA